MGGYSRGCFECLRRRVKCDEGKPSCQRCERRNLECPGYRREDRFVFRSMNHKVAHPSSVPTRHARRRGRHPMPSGIHFGLARLQGPSIGTLARFLQPSLDWEAHSRMFFFHHYVVPSSAQTSGYLSFLPELVLARPDDPLLHGSLSAAALTLSGRLLNLPYLIEKGRLYYSLALRYAGHAMNVSTYAKSDACLSSIILLQLFEVINGLTERTDPHDNVLSRLVRMRDTENVQTQASRSLSAMIDYRFTMKDILGHQKLPPPATKTQTDDDPSPTTKIWQLFRNVSQVCRTMHELVDDDRQGRDVAKLTIIDTLSRATTLFELATKFPKTAPERFLYGEVQLESMFSDGDTAPPAALTFNHLQHGAVWIMYWCHMIRLCERLRTFKQQFGYFDQEDHQDEQQGPGPSEKELQNGTSDAVDKIYGSVPYMLGHIGKSGDLQSPDAFKAAGAFFLLPGLTMAVHLNELSTMQRGRILNSLSQIGRGKGVGLALRCEERWLAMNPNFSLEASRLPLVSVT